jgi:hypothetical protein
MGANAVISRTALRDALSERPDGRNVAAIAAIATHPLGGAPSKTAAGRTAVVIVHGISPIQRYSIQDQYADGLLGYLNACETVASTGRTWTSSIYWPESKSVSDLRPSAIRIHLEPSPPNGASTTQVPPTDGPDPGDLPQLPLAPLTPIGEHTSTQIDGASFDVFEGYWSPYTKHKTNIASLLTWLLNATFLATSSTARLPATWRKIGWDFGYIAAAILIAAVFAGLAVREAVVSWGTFQSIYTVPPATGSAPLPTSLGALFNAARALSGDGWRQIILSLVIGFILAQLFTLLYTRWKTGRRTDALRADVRSQTSSFATSTMSAARWQTWAGWLLFAFLVAFVGFDLWSARNYPGAASCSFELVVFVSLVQFARFLLDFVVEDILGDVQVYTTHDSNADFFAIREKVVADVTAAVVGVLKASPAYDRIHIAGHSLGSTIALDVLMRVRMLVQENPSLEPQWRRIRSLLTFGTALEKTRFFFDVRNPSVSAAHDQWDADVFGKFFTADDTVLQIPAPVNPGIYWRNVFYVRDVVANEILSYKTDVPLGQDFAAWSKTTTPRLVCDNGGGPLVHKKPFWSFVHGDYTGDPLFWAIAGALVRRG